MFSFFKKPKKVLMGSTAANADVRKVLASHGDDGSEPRHVIHYAYPLGSSDPATRKKINAWLYAQNFKVKSAESRDGVIFENTQNVDDAIFDELTNSFISFFDELDWEYDGWECAVAIKEDKSA